MEAGSFCPYCGKPISLSDAVFCPHCGRGLTASASQGQTPTPAPTFAPAPGMVYPAPGAASAPAWQQSAPPAPAPPMAAAPMAAAPQWSAPAPMFAPAPAPTMVVTASPKTPGIAVLLELLLPGSGAMYADQVGIGVVWLLASFAASSLAWLLLAAIARDAVENPTIFTSNFDLEPNYTPLYMAFIIVGMAGVFWLLARTTRAASYARAYNRRLAIASGGNPALVGFVSGESGAPVDTGRAVLASVGVGLFVTLGTIYKFLSIGSRDLTIFGSYLTAVMALSALLLPALYWVALSRLPLKNGWRVFGELALISLVVFVIVHIVDSVFALMQYKAAIQQICAQHTAICTNIPDVSWVQIATDTNSVVYGVVIPTLLTSLIAIGTARTFAIWSSIRPWSNPAALRRQLLYALAVLALTLLFEFAYGAVATSLDADQPTRVLLTLGQYVIGVAAVVIASVGMVRLPRQGTRGAAPSMAPSMAPNVPVYASSAPPLLLR